MNLPILESKEETSKNLPDGGFFLHIPIKIWIQLYPTTSILYYFLDCHKRIKLSVSPTYFDIIKNIHLLEIDLGKRSRNQYR